MKRQLAIVAMLASAALTSGTGCSALHDAVLGPDKVSIIVGADRLHDVNDSAQLKTLLATNTNYRATNVVVYPDGYAELYVWACPNNVDNRGCINFMLSTSVEERTSENKFPGFVFPVKPISTDGTEQVELLPAASIQYRTVFWNGDNKDNNQACVNNKPEDFLTTASLATAQSVAKQLDARDWESQEVNGVTWSCFGGVV